MSIFGEFDGFKLRSVDTLADLERLCEWIEADDAHRGIFPPQFFMSHKLGGDSRPSCYALEDEKGVVFYIRLSRAARVRIQFAPEAAEHEQRRRVMRGLFHGMAFLESALSQAGCEEWIFDTVSPELKHLAIKGLGFTESAHELVRAIADPAKKTEVA